MNKTELKNATYGIRVSLRDDDPFKVLVDENWNTSHWFQNRHERDQALKEMSREHEYSRQGDAPTLIFEAVERSS